MLWRYFRIFDTFATQKPIAEARERVLYLSLYQTLYHIHMETPYLLKYYDALLDSTTNAVLTISSNPAVIVFLKECMTDTLHAQSVNYPNYTNPKSFFLTPFFLASVKPKNYSKWTWDLKNRLFSKTKTELVDNNLLTRSRLAENKKQVIDKIITNISLVRSNARANINFQEMIYFTKKAQAKAFKDSGYDESSIIEYPYVIQHADYAGITARQAADDILFKAKLGDEFLAKTELLRLRYFNKVKKAISSEELTAIYEEFIRDCYVNAQV